MKHNPQYKNTENTIAIDLDGVIHKNSKGFHDGTIYDDPIDGTKEALKELSKNYDLIIYSCKARPDRNFADGNSGASHINAWLEKHDLVKYIKSIEVFKPPAKFYIDDRAIRFNNWTETLNDVKKYESIDRSNESIDRHSVLTHRSNELKDRSNASKDTIVKRNVVVFL